MNNEVRNSKINPTVRHDIWTRVFRSYAITQSSDYVLRSVLADFPADLIDRFDAEEIARDAIDAVRASLAGFARDLAEQSERFYPLYSERIQ